MSKRRRVWAMVVLLMALPIVFGACSTKRRAEPNPGQMEQLAQEFMADLRGEILVYRNDTQKLLEIGLLVSGEKGAAGLDQLDAFYDSYKTNQPCVLTIAKYSTSPLVVVRVQFAEDGNGYYFRYELDESATIAVTPKVIDRVKVERDEALEKTTLILLEGRTELAAFSFKPRTETQNVTF